MLADHQADTAAYHARHPAHEQDLRQGLPDAVEQALARAKDQGHYTRTETALLLRMPDRYWPQQVRLQQYEVTDPQQRHVVDLVRPLLQGDALHDFVARGCGLVLYGAVGTGKDHLMAAVLFAAASLGITCDRIHGQEFHGQFRDNITLGVGEGGILDRLERPQVLGISELLPPAGQLTDWNKIHLNRLLDRRYSRRLCTWATLNVPRVDAAGRAIDPDVYMDQQLSASTADRLRDRALMLPCYWPSHRRPL